MGWEREDTPEGEVRAKLQLLGLAGDQADSTLSRFNLEEIQQQIEWLPYHNAKKPAALLVAAIEGNYDEPLALRANRPAEMQELEQTEGEVASFGEKNMTGQSLPFDHG